MWPFLSDGNETQKIWAVCPDFNISTGGGGAASRRGFDVNIGNAA